MKTIQEIIAMEKSIAELLSELTEQIAKTTNETTMSNVKIISKNSASVNLSSLNSGILCPYYYIQSAQADAVKRKLQEAKTATEFVSKIQTMIGEQKVKVGSDVIRLNPATISVLKSYAENL
jgi:hypothetical protein